MECEYKAVERENTQDHCCHEPAEFTIAFGSVTGHYCKAHADIIMNTGGISYKIKNIG